MPKKLRSFFKSTFVRYIVSYILLTALLVGGITLYMYSYYRKSVYSSVISGETSLAWQIKYMTDGYFSALGNFASRMDAQPGENARAQALQSFYLPCEGAHTYVYLDSGRVISAQGGTGFSEFAREVSFSELNDADLKALLETREFTLSPAQRISVYGEENEYVPAVYPFTGGSVVCLLPLGAFDVPDTRDVSTACSRYVISGGRIITRGDSFSVSDEIILRVSRHVNSEEEIYTETRRMNGREHVFIVLAGAQGESVYTSVLTLTGIYTKAASVWLGFTAVLLSIALPCVIFMIIISRRNLAPIQRMSSHFGTVSGARTDDIQAISRGISELESRNMELETRSLAARRHMFARELALGRYEDAESAREAGAEIGLDIAKQYFCVLLIGAPRERGRDVYLDSVLSPAPEGVVCAGTELLENEQMLVVAFSDEVKLLDEYARAVSALPRVRAQHIAAAMSGVHDDFKKLPAAFLEATSAYESRFVMGDAHLLSFSEIAFAGGRTVPAAAEYARGIKEALAEGDRTRVDEAIGELTAFLKGGEMNLFTFRQVYNDIINAILAEAGDSGYSGAEIYNLFSLSGCRSLDELDGILRSVCESVINARSSAERSPLIQKIMRVMTENYTASDFSISRAAELSGVTPGRLAAELKTNMGMTPNDYLTMLRMEEAKKLLAQTDLAVGDVCGLSGYADASSFTRRFRLYTGMTPLAYRQSAKEGQTTPGEETQHEEDA